MPPAPPRSSIRAKPSAGGEGTPSAAPPTWFAVASPGLEAVVHAELRAFEGKGGLTACRAVPGGSECHASEDAVRVLLPRLRVTTRVWRRLATVRARAFGELERKWVALPWADFLAPGQAVRVEASVHRCRLHHTGALKQRLLQAAAAALGHPVLGAQGDGGGDGSLADAAPAEADGETAPPALRVLVRGEDDAFTVSVDASGDRLNVRGYRQEIGKAPLRETLAAGLLALLGWTPEEALVDPMCGSGTLPIEAALLALGHLPPRQAFAMDAWPCRQSVRLPAIVEEQPTPGRTLRIWGFDRDDNVLGRAQRNAVRAGVQAHVVFRPAAFETLQPPCPPGLLVFNPPYGHRLSSDGRAFVRLAAVLAQTWKGWRAGVLVPAGAKLAAPGLTEMLRHPLRNGGLATELVCVRM